MKKFTFNLEKILNLRAWAEKEARIELGNAARELSEAGRLLALNESARRNALPPEAAGGFSLDALRIGLNYAMRLDKEKEALLERLAAASEAADLARGRWQAAAAEKKALENVKDRRRQAHRKETLLKEEQEADDIRRPTAP